MSEHTDRSETSDSITPEPSVRWKDSLKSLSASLSLHIDNVVEKLRESWERGERVQIEAFGKDYERVAEHEEQLLDLIYHEVLVREEFGETPRVEDYLARFPKLADRLQRQFAVHGAIESEWEDAGSEVLDVGASVPVSSEDGSPRASSTEWNLSPGSPRRRRKFKSSLVEAPPGYELLDELGRGGMAVVFRARQQSLDRIVALKMILGGTITSPEVLQRFEQEARTVAQLQHPGIVHIYEVGDHRGLPYLSIEYAAGGSLHDWLRGRPIAPLEAARVIEQVARTTQFAHERGVIHRDLKPANILFTERPADLSSDSTLRSDSGVLADRSSAITGQLKIADFGLARFLHSGNNLTMTGQVIGTPSYMAPEQARGTGYEASPTLDVYSLGAILYELLTGRPPFRGATVLDTLDQVRNEEPVSPRRLQPRVPRDLETICLKCLEKAAERRYSTAQELAEDLQRFQNGQTITARPVKAAERLWKWMQRSPAVASLIAVAILFAIVGLAGVLEGARRATDSAKIAKFERDQAIIHSREANLQKESAQTERARAIEAQTQAEAAKTRAVAARAEAEINFRSAMDAVNALTLIGQQLRSQPRQLPTTRLIFEETLRFYEGFLDTHAEDPTLRFLAASALFRAGDIRDDMGDRAKSLDSLNRSAELLDWLVNDDPGNLQYLRMLAEVHWLRGNVIRKESRYEEADAAYLTAITLRDAILSQQPGDTSSLVAKANVIVNRCVLLSATGRVGESLKQYPIAAELLRKLVRGNPRNPNFRSELALCLDDFGRTLVYQGRRREGEPLLRESLALRERLHQELPKDSGVRIHLARSLMIAARLEATDDQFEPANAKLTRGIELLDPLLKDFPEIYEYYGEMMMLYTEQLRVAVRQKGVLGVAAEWQKMSDFLNLAHSRFPDDEYYAERNHEKYRYGALIWETPEAQGLFRFARGFLPAREPPRTNEPDAPTATPPGSP